MTEKPYTYHPPIRTGRLLIKRPSLHDFDHVFAMSKDPQVMRFIGDGAVFQWTRDVAYKKFESLVSARLTHGLGEMSVYRLSDGAYLGWCAVGHSRFLDGMELGYRFRPDTWGRGYASEAATAMLTAAYTATNADRILACTHPDNRASIRVLEKLGFRCACYKPSKPIGRDIPVFSISRKQWAGEGASERTCQGDRM